MSVSKRADTGRWRARYRGPDGKQRSKDFDTKAAATTWANEQDRRVRRNEWTDPDAGHVTVEEVYRSWLASRDLKATTRNGYESLWKTCIEPTWGSTRVDRVTPLAVRTWVTKMEGIDGRVLSASRRRQAYGVLASVLDAAVLDRRIITNPARERMGGRSSFLPRVPNVQRRRYLSHEEVGRVAESAGGDHQALILVLAYSGLRWGEATALRVQDVDLLRCRLHVVRSSAELNGEIIYQVPKTHQARQVPMPKALRDVIQPLLAGKGPEDLIFTAPNGGPLRSANFRSRVWFPALRAAAVEPLRIHDLRHTAAGLAVDAGANVKGVQLMLGHADAAMTLNVYADLFDGHMEEVANRLDAAISKAREASVRPDNGNNVALIASVEA